MRIDPRPSIRPTVGIFNARTHPRVTLAFRPSSLHLPYTFTHTHRRKGGLLRIDIGSRYLTHRSGVTVTTVQPQLLFSESLA